MSGKIIVVGSFVYDLVVWLPYFPRRGETLLASNFKSFAGGKGFNQAVSVRRCGAQVSMLGKVGADSFGDTFLEILDRESIDRTFVIQDASTTTSLGIPMIDPHGDNSIIGVPRANTLLTVAELEVAYEFIAQHQLLMLQMEIPLEVSLKAARIAHSHGLTVIYNPAPAAHPLSAIAIVDDSGQPVVDWLVPNEVEAAMLTGLPVTTPAEALTAGQVLLSHSAARRVVITMGSQGAVVITPSEQFQTPAFQITPLDPTGAGDAFCGAFAAAISEGWSLQRAVRFANAAGALAVTKAGAEPSLPCLAEIEAFILNHPKGGHA